MAQHKQSSPDKKSSTENRDFASIDEDHQQREIARKAVKRSMRKARRTSLHRK